MDNKKEYVYIEKLSEPLILDYVEIHYLIKYLKDKHPFCSLRYLPNNKSWQYIFNNWSHNFQSETVALKHLKSNLTKNKYIIVKDKLIIMV